MAIHERVYQRMSAPPQAPASRPWAIIARVVGRHVMRSWKTRLVMFASLAPGLMFGLGIYFATRNEESLLSMARQFALTNIVSLEDVTAEVWRRVAANVLYVLEGHVQLWFGLILTPMLGATLIAEDLRTQAHEVYMARPLRPRDYVLGKMAVIGTRLLFILAGPPLLVLAIGNALIPSSFLPCLHFYPLTVVFAGIVAVSNAAVMVGVSALTRSARYATAIWFLVYFVTWVVSAILTETTSNRWFELVSWRSNQQIILSEMLALEPLHETIVSMPSTTHTVWPSVLVLSLASWWGWRMALGRMKPRHG
jgi:ABC-type transport system involved in multi-copper enzyme maturation permease subunit